MIYLNPEVRSGLGEDTFWTWIHRAFSGQSKFLHHGDRPGKGDTVLQYSTMGAPKFPDAYNIGLLWELYPEMLRVLGHDAVWANKVKAISECAKHCDLNVVPSAVVAEQYPEVLTRVVPIGVDFELFHPSEEPVAERVGFWCGTDHPMKGFSGIPWDLADHWVIVWKSAPRKSRVPSYVSVEEHTKIPQTRVAELMRRCTFFVAPGLLRPFFLSEWEAMATGLQLEWSRIPVEEKCFVPSGTPRHDLVNMSWSRDKAKEVWNELFFNRS